jgi:hypothetical protein
MIHARVTQVNDLSKLGNFQNSRVNSPSPSQTGRRACHDKALMEELAELDRLLGFRARPPTNTFSQIQQRATKPSSSFHPTSSTSDARQGELWNQQEDEDEG